MNKHEKDRQVEQAATASEAAPGMTVQDLAAALLESWKLVLAVPLLAAAIGFAATLITETAYETVTVLRLTPGQAQSMTGPGVLDPVARSLGLIERNGGSGRAARQEILDRISMIPTTANNFAFYFRGDTPEEAEQLSKLVVRNFLAREQPREIHRQQYRRELDSVKALMPSYRMAVDRERTILERAQKEEAEAAEEPEEPAATAQLQPEVPPFEQVRYFTQLLDGVRALEKQIIDLEYAIRGLGEEVVLLSPTSASREPTPVDKPYALLGFLLGLLAVVLFVWARETVAKMSRSGNARHARLSRALSFAGR